ncbi:MAG: adenine nucleotide alpha hydrolase [Rhodospirillaceae bacterium]|nr:adenine nucleotide alpha hydrolase [Alphaproteobacteria bacterium]MBR71824.1 adenine nucleotide alpha hydrolase [Rhodospirillaceae bacterium]|tara:strand:+ start:922 stop:1758 length:837 start_codon:yes stop_codon:yes gene_type:complete
MEKINKLNENLFSLKSMLQFDLPIVIAVSGGVDSMTLAYAAHTEFGDNITMVHAISPAVPPKATSRVKLYSERYSWNLTCINAGEFSDEDYRKNPIDRCFYCKKNLYNTITMKFPDHVICSGANLDDLADYRPGLLAAEECNVIHPFVEAGLYKSEIRELALYFGLDEVASLPSAPCLSSRIETGRRIDPNELTMVDKIETVLREIYRPKTVRCRVRENAVIIEFDKATMLRLDKQTKKHIHGSVLSIISSYNCDRVVSIETYQMGSAFVHKKNICST